MTTRNPLLTIPLLLLACATGGATTPTTPTAGTCDAFRGQASAAEIGRSPFANEEAEVLAIETSGTFLAPRDVYERILADLTLIRAHNVRLQNLVSSPSWAPDQLLVSLDARGMSAVQAGTYTDWDCPNARYGVTSKEVTSFVLLQFGHRFNAPMLAADYQTLAHVESAEGNGSSDSSDLCVSIEDETTYHYIFDAGSGDCPSGCTVHEYWGFTTTKNAPGVVTPIGTFLKDGPGAPPAWFTALPDCTKWL